jgi:small subunit ribosomal protein S1
METLAPTPMIEEGYWQSLLTDEEAVQAEPAMARPASPEAAASSEQHSATGSRSLELLWASAQCACQSDKVLEIDVIGYNRGGVLIDWQGLHGFVPASHLIGMPAIADDSQRTAEFTRRVGQRLHAKIIELDRGRGRFVLSERQAYNDRSRLEMLMAEMQPGQTRCGIVTTVCDFGAFVDLGGIEGLAHISEISWGRINHPADVLCSGQAVEVYVMHVDCAQKRVALSVKRLKPDPWLAVSERYQIDQIVDGVVTTVVDFGAFVRLEEGVEGLIHVSELAEGNFLHPRNVVQEGDAVKVKVLNIEAAHRRLGLSLRQVNAVQEM